MNTKQMRMAGYMVVLFLTLVVLLIVLATEIPQSYRLTILMDGYMVSMDIMDSVLLLVQIIHM